MFSIFTSISALVALTFLTQASTSLAGHVRHRHGARMIPSPVDNKLQVIGRRAAAGMTEIPTGQLQMLQSEMTTFQGWMDTYINSTKEMDQATALAQLKQEFEAFNGWVNAFLSNVMGTGPSTLPALPTTAPLTASPQSSVVAAFSSALSTAPASYSSLAAILASSSPALAVSTSSAVAASSSPSSTSVAVQELVASPSHTAVSTTLQVVQSPLSSAPISSTPSLPASSALSSTPQTSASAASSPVPSPSSPSGGTGGSFNANSDSNVAVYYGQSGATGQFSLEQMCQDSNVDIVILAFVSTFFGAGGYPTINLGAACSGTTAAMSAKGATGLLSCPTVAQQITTCQGLGKKVLVSLGGAIGTSAFSGTQQADQFATMLWNLFGAGTGEDAGLRPFGQVKVDGFDLGKKHTIITNLIQVHYNSANTRDTTRQRRPQHNLLHRLRHLPPHNHVHRHQQNLLHLRRAAMPTPRRLDPPRRHANHGLRLRPILQQRPSRLRRRPARFPRQLQSLEWRSERQRGKGAEIIHRSARVPGVCGGRVCGSGDDGGSDCECEGGRRE